MTQPLNLNPQTLHEQTQAEKVALMLINDGDFYRLVVTRAIDDVYQAGIPDSMARFVALNMVFYRWAHPFGLRLGLTDHDGGLIALAGELADCYTEAMEARHAGEGLETGDRPFNSQD